ncbi:unnamed protein product [Gordionus sp. m RMFG-2023]|uniref:intraflagellar transport protein 52 homolog n=1 Tax=Gordionus sp. m RMFG-2023 TaxID=3053472 RepID=UPI0030E31A5B
MSKEILVKLNDNLNAASFKYFLKSLKEIYKTHIIQQYPKELKDILYAINFDSDIQHIEIESIKKFINTGGTFICFINGQNNYKENNLTKLINYFGINLKNSEDNYENVISLVANKNLHPREAVIHYNKNIDRCFNESNPDIENSEPDEIHFSFIYPYGVTLTIDDSRAYAILGTGKFCFPTDSCICALHIDKESGGKFCVIGSWHVFSDEYIKEFQNEILKTKLFEFLISTKMPNHNLNHSFTRIETIPDISALSDQVKSCFSFNEFNVIPNHDLDLIIRDEPFWHFNPCSFISKKIIKESDNEANQKITLIKPPYEQIFPKFQLILHPIIFPQPIEMPELEIFDLD